MATIFVGPIGDYTTVQAAVNAAADGDIIKCKANQLFSETLTLPNKGALTTGITITSDASAASLPAAGYRTNPSYAAFMPKIQSPGGGDCTVITAAGANGYTFRHIEFPEVPHGYNSIVRIGQGDSAQAFPSQEPYNYTIDQCWIHGGAVCGQKVAIESHGKNITISNNYISDIKSFGQDSLAIAGYNGHGPLTVTNNYLSCGTYAHLRGGADPGMRTFLTVTGTPTTTTANVTCAEAGHTLAELAVGDGLSCKVGGVWTFTTITSIAGSGASGSIGFAALPNPPDVGTSTIKAGCILKGLTFRYNYVRNDPTWINGVLPKVSGLGATASTSSGTLPAGTYYYRVQAFHDGGYQEQTVNGTRSAEASATLGATGKITLNWTSVGVSGAYYRVWRGTSPSGENEWTDLGKTITGTSYVDDGTRTYTAGSIPSASQWQIKNLFEIKAAQDAQVDSNIFEYCWRGVDIGFAVWLKTVNQDGNGPFLQSKNITFEKNIIRHCFGFLEVHGREANDISAGYPGPLTVVTVRNNLVYDSSQAWGQGDDNYACAWTDSITNFTFDHNTVVHTTSGAGGGLLVVESDLPPLPSLVVTNNLLRAETYGIHDSHGTGAAALAAAAPGYSFQKNGVADASTPTYPSNNFYETAALWQNEFLDYAGGDYHLKTTSTMHNAALDGKDVGCDIDLVLAATATVISGDPASVGGGGGGGGGTPVNPVTHRRRGRGHK
jgi:hypothetical protein